MPSAFSFLAFILPIMAFAQPVTAFRAYTALPPDAAWRLVRIGASEGRPQPERWHFVVHAPAEPGGLRDYVVAAGRLAVINTVSQFARDARVEDILPPGSIRIDSDRVAAVAAEYARANKFSFDSLNYELAKNIVDLQPVWKVTCLDTDNRTIGWLVCDARTGEIIAHGNFLRSRNVPPQTIGEPLFETPKIQGGFRHPSEAREARGR